jgi:hypothetical protein
LTFGGRSAPRSTCMPPIRCPPYWTGWAIPPRQMSPWSRPPPRVGCWSWWSAGVTRQMISDRTATWRQGRGRTWTEPNSYPSFTPREFSEAATMVDRRCASGVPFSQLRTMT